jgi:hypothetical protein
MLVINEHPIETIEDVFWVFEPDEFILGKELMDTFHYTQVGTNRALWRVDAKNILEPFFEIKYNDNQKNEFLFWYKMFPNDNYKKEDDQPLIELVGLLSKWFSINRPEKTLDFVTRPPSLFSWAWIKGPPPTTP